MKIEDQMKGYIINEEPTNVLKEGRDTITFAS